jgi:hypothetical protein
LRAFSGRARLIAAMRRRWTAISTDFIPMKEKNWKTIANNRRVWYTIFMQYICGGRFGRL